MPANDRLWLNNGDGAQQRRKQAMEPNEEQAIGHRNFRFRGNPPAQHVQPMPQQHDLSLKPCLRLNW
jgi:hypothetical protein